jgi:hypothetical protein
MKTIKFYTETKKYMGWKKLYSFEENWLECRNWITSGNGLVIDGVNVDAFETGKLSIVFKTINQ